jgi:hypothetical protein
MDDERVENYIQSIIDENDDEKSDEETIEIPKGRKIKQRTVIDDEKPKKVKKGRKPKKNIEDYDNEEDDEKYGDNVLQKTISGRLTSQEREPNNKYEYVEDKPKKKRVYTAPKTKKQLEAFQKAKKVRDENIRAIREKKEKEIEETMNKVIERQLEKKKKLKEQMKINSTKQATDHKIKNVLNSLRDSKINEIERKPQTLEDYYKNPNFKPLYF